MTGMSNHTNIYWIEHIPLVHMSEHAAAHMLPPQEQTGIILGKGTHQAKGPVIWWYRLNLPAVKNMKNFLLPHQL